MCFEMPARILSCAGADARADVDGRIRPVSLVVLEGEGVTVTPGDWVLVHTGLAVRRLRPDEATARLAFHREMHAPTEETG